MSYTPLDLLENYLRRFVIYPSEHALVARGVTRCPLMAQNRHAQCADECPLSEAKRTSTSRCLPISIYEYTA